MSLENEFVFCFPEFSCFTCSSKTRDSILHASRTYTNFGNNEDVSLAKRGPGNEVVAASDVSCDVIST